MSSNVMSPNAASPAVIAVVEKMRHRLPSRCTATVLASRRSDITSPMNPVTNASISRIIDAFEGSIRRSAIRTRSGSPTTTAFSFPIVAIGFVNWARYADWALVTRACTWETTVLVLAAEFLKFAARTVPRPPPPPSDSFPAAYSSSLFPTLTANVLNAFTPLSTPPSTPAGGMHLRKSSDTTALNTATSSAGYRTMACATQERPAAFGRLHGSLSACDNSPPSSFSGSGAATATRPCKAFGTSLASETMLVAAAVAASKWRLTKSLSRM